MQDPYLIYINSLACIWQRKRNNLKSWEVSLHEHEVRDTSLLVPGAASVPTSLSEHGGLSKMIVIALFKDVVLILVLIGF